MAPFPDHLWLPHGRSRQWHAEGQSMYSFALLPDRQVGSHSQRMDLPFVVCTRKWQTPGSVTSFTKRNMVTV